MVKRCGHTEAKIEFRSRGKNWNGSENVVGGGGKYWSRSKGVYRPMISLGLSYYHWGPNRQYKSLYSKISNLLLIYKLVRSNFPSTYNFFSK